MNVVNNKKIIALIGMMGVGKTTIGNKLADKLGYYFIDCDQEIEDFEHCSISDIFANKGEKYFREIEEKIICEIVHRDEQMVLSLGGGAYVNEQIRKLLQEKAIVIWLHANIDDLVMRTAGKNNRPLLNHKNFINDADKNNFKDKRQILLELTQQRQKFYQQCDFDFDTTNNNQEFIVNKIIQQLKKND
ncbi:MAG: shikimate kinase [Alphaproteobacteria bacterium]